MIKFSSSFKLNEIHRVDSPFNEDPKNVNFFQGGPNFGGGTAGKFREIGNNRDIYCYANWGVVNLERAYQSLPLDTKIPVIPQFPYMPDQFLGNIKKSQNLTLFKGPSLPKYKGVFKKFLYGQTSLVID